MNRDRLRRRKVAGGGGGAGITDTWHYIGESGEPSIENGFITIGSEKTGFRKVGDYVEFTGLFYNGAANTTMFTLPVGYRPSNQIRILAICVDVSTGGAVSQFDGVLVNPDGTVVSGQNLAGFTLPLWSMVPGTFCPLDPADDV